VQSGGELGNYLYIDLRIVRSARWRCAGLNQRRLTSRADDSSSLIGQPTWTWPGTSRYDGAIIVKG